MPHTVPTLEQQRHQILQQIEALGDFRPGSVSAVQVRCGQPSCHCARPKDPGHGPSLRLTYKIEGKSRIESLSAPGALQKAQREIAAFRQFQQHIRELIEVNVALCQLRPPETASGLTPQEKKRLKRSSKKFAAK